MKRGYILVAAGATVLTAFAGLGSKWYLQKEYDERVHRERQETELFISRPPNAKILLFKAGNDLSAATAVKGFDGRAAWLSPGNYFLQSSFSENTCFFPIPLSGYRNGPDDDGNFVISLREFPKEKPPLLFASLPEFMYIPSGSFLIGDRQNPREQHYVWLTGYYINPYEVTNGEFRMFAADSSGYNNETNWCAAGKKWMVINPSRATTLLKTRDANYKRYGRDDLPVLWVNWYEANAYCRWLTKKIGGKRWLFSLPSDAEWEKAARGPDNFDYAFGMTISDAEVQFYNWRKNPDAPITVVGITDSRRLYSSNRYGLYHMTGNANEWSQSVSQPYNREDPYVDDERNHDDTPGQRSVRGGSWYSASIAYLRIPYRDSFQPEHSNQEVGFRIVARMLP
jgi:formylglycine-generating enzyme required for sulfatase activity